MPGTQRHCFALGLVVDTPRRCGRTGHRAEASGWSPGRGQDLQGAHRRLQFASVLTGEAKESPRKVFFYISDDGDILGIRMDAHGTQEIRSRAGGVCLLRQC